MIEIPHPVNSNHNGGQLQFLGNLLYFGTGDGGSGGDPPNNAQNKDVPARQAAADRPAALRRQALLGPRLATRSSAEPGRDEIYSYGLRNPFRFSFDTTTREQPRIAIGDVGQNRFEELDYTTVGGRSGANFGWDAFEGFAPYDDENSGTPDPGGTVKPIFAYSHSRGGSCSIIGGYVVRDRRLPGAARPLRLRRPLRGPAAQPRPAPERGERRPQARPRRRPRPSSFGEDASGRLYVASLEGPVYRLVPRGCAARADRCQA